MVLRELKVPSETIMISESEYDVLVKKERSEKKITHEYITEDKPVSVNYEKYILFSLGVYVTLHQYGKLILFKYYENRNFPKE